MRETDTVVLVYCLEACGSNSVIDSNEESVHVGYHSELA